MAFKPSVYCSGDVTGIPCSEEPLELTMESYNIQMMNPDAFWKCPVCRGTADWNDECLDDMFDPPEIINFRDLT